MTGLGSNNGPHCPSLAKIEKDIVCNGLKIALMANNCIRKISFMFPKLRFHQFSLVSVVETLICYFGVV